MLTQLLSLSSLEHATDDLFAEWKTYLRKYGRNSYRGKKFDLPPRREYLSISSLAQLFNQWQVS